ncbi:response regulator [Caenimonas terrae]|uniref:Response regulator n=1 Tax=Caenimonas terrae TaxID=696074 RepID=A0ABW0N7K7_9BURK
MTGNISVVLVEDNPLHAQRYRDNLALDPLLGLVGEFALAADAIAGIEALAPDVVLVDLGLPDGNGLDVVRHVRTHLPQAAVMVVSIFGDEPSLLAAIEAGATGYLLKDTGASDFNQNIHALRAGGSPISPSLARHLLRRLQTPVPKAPAVSPLSRRETAILDAIAQGSSVVEIGALLHISPLTVKTHVQNIYRKLEARSRQHAVYLARSRGLLSP